MKISLLLKGLIEYLFEKMEIATVTPTITPTVTPTVTPIGW
jgi:hypothetical protein